jgi:hypothetical protein
VVLVSNDQRATLRTKPWPRSCFEASVATQLGVDAQRHLTGSLLPAILFIKGQAAADEGNDGILTGADGEALAKALPRLGFRPEESSTCLIVLPDGDRLDDDGLLQIVEVLDPLVTVVLDGEAATAITDALQLPMPPTPMGPVAHLARLIVAVDGFEDMLSSQDGKRRAWEQLKLAVRPGDPF